LGPRVNGYVAELTEYHIQLIYKPSAVNRADELSWRPNLAPTDDNELTLVLPDHLFVSPDAPATPYIATRTKTEDYNSDDTLVNTDDSRSDISTPGLSFFSRLVTLCIATDFRFRLGLLDLLTYS